MVKCVLLGEISQIITSPKLCGNVMMLELRIEEYLRNLYFGNEKKKKIEKSGQQLVVILDNL